MIINKYVTSAGKNLTISLLLVILAIILAVFFGTTPRWIKVGAMFICWLADMMLAQYAPFTRLTGGYSFTKGAVLFMAAHILYIGAFALLAGQTGLPMINAGFWIGSAVTVGVICLLIGVYLRNPAKAPAMLAIGIAYGLIIGSLGTVVFIFTFQQKGWAFLALAGIISFMFSDLLIGLEKIGGLKISNIDGWIWFFYPIGQLLIIL